MLKLDKVTFSYEQDKFEFDFELHTGHCLALMGDSGCGKSTLLNLIAGFLAPHSGHIYFNGQPIDPLKAHQRPLTMLFQEHNLFNHLDVYKNIALGIRPSGKLTQEENDQLIRALEKVQLTDMEKRLPESLSGGQRQRVALARCLLRSKPLLLLDEPFGGLNEKLKLEIKSLLNDLKNTLNLTMIWVTHDKEDVDGIADRIMKIKNGRIASIE